VQYGHYPSAAAIAHELERSPVTLRGWASGGGGAPPESVPLAMLPRFSALFARALPGYSPEQVRALLTGSADDLEQALAMRSAPALTDIIAREADQSSGSLYLENDAPLGLVRVAGRGAPPPAARVPLGRRFRIAFSTRLRSGFVIGLQSAPGGWGVVPCALDRAGGTLHLPGPMDDDDPGWMSEENETGPHLFVAVQASAPFPADLYIAGRDGVALDRTLLAHVVRSFEAQDPKARRMFAMAVEIT
jgi:hypothetical protein